MNKEFNTPYLRNDYELRVVMQRIIWNIYGIYEVETGSFTNSKKRENFFPCRKCQAAPLFTV
jgi:hypothetical protein